jgi:hypothetical protein
MVDPRCVHLVVVKHVMRYLKGTMDYGFKYVAYSEFSLLEYPDSYWVGSVAKWKKYIGMFLHFGIRYDFMD